MHHRAAVSTIVLVAGVLVGCVTENRPATCNADKTTIELTMSASALTPNDPAACRGQIVTMTLDPEVNGVFHIHGLDTVVPATPIRSGEPVTLEFTADRSGQFPIELHLADDPTGLSLGIFTVHER